MITKMRIENFKSWKDTGEMTFAPITAFFGTNSSGKSSILQLLLMLKQTVESSDRVQALNLGDGRTPVSLGTFSDIAYTRSAEGRLKWSISWELPNRLEVTDPEKAKLLFSGNSLCFEAEVVANGSGRVVVGKLAYELDGNKFILERKKAKYEYELSAASKYFKFRPIRGHPRYRLSPIKCYGFPTEMRASYQNADFLSDFELAFEKLMTQLYYLGPLREFPKREYISTGAQPADMGFRGERVVDALLASQERRKKISRGRGYPKMSVQEYVAHWLKKLQLADEFAVKPITEGENLYRVWVRTTPQATEVLLPDVGFGVSQILPVIAICYYVPEGSIILLEQPEINLHPSVQLGLADVLLDAVNTRKVQIILESHSEHLLRRLQRRIAEGGTSKDNVALYFCNLQDGASHLSELKLDLFCNITNWPQNFFGDEMAEMVVMTEAAIRRQMENKS